MIGPTILSSSSSVSVADALTQIGSIVTSCIGWIESNLVLMTCFVAGMIPVGFMVIRKAKSTSRK